MTQINPWLCPEGAQVELSRERCVPKVLKLSSEVSRCKPLRTGSSTAWMTRPWATAAAAPGGA